MRSNLLVFLFTVLQTLCVDAQKLYKNDVVLPYGSSALTAESQVQIKKIWERLPLNCAVELNIISEKEARKLDPREQTVLTKARAQAMRSFLTTQKMVNLYDIEINLHAFIEEEKIHGTMASFKRKVRMPYKVYSVVLSKEVPICYNYTEVEKQALSSKEPACFTINTAQDAMITGPNGVIVQFSANSFLLPDNKLSAEVKIKLWEFTSTEDLVLAGLTTTSSGRLLETGGTIYITAEYEGSCLRLIRNSTVLIKFPVAGEKNDTMRFFKGVPLPRIVDWKKTNSIDKGGPVTNDEGDSLSSGYYILQVPGFGWINCDKFSDVKNVINVVFGCPAKFDGTGELIFTEIKSIMGGYIEKRKNYNELVFAGVPEGMEVVLLLYTISKDKKKLFYAAQKFKAGEKPNSDIQFKEIDSKDFRSVVATIRNL